MGFIPGRTPTVTTVWVRFYLERFGFVSKSLTAAWAVLTVAAR